MTMKNNCLIYLCVLFMCLLSGCTVKKSFQYYEDGSVKEKTISFTKKGKLYQEIERFHKTGKLYYKAFTINDDVINVSFYGSDSLKYSESNQYGIIDKAISVTMRNKSNTLMLIGIPETKHYPQYIIEYDTLGQPTKIMVPKKNIEIDFDSCATSTRNPK